MPTLKDIAHHVGVSISTVSRVMNNDVSRHISQETKLKIWKAASDLGYVVSQSARSEEKAAKARTAYRQVGCIVSVPQNKYNHPYFSPILAGIETKLAELQCALAYILTTEEIISGTVMGKQAQESKLDGMIIVENIPAAIYESIKKKVPAVVGIDISDASVPVILYDRVEAAKSAVRHLIEQGHKRIGFIGGAGLVGDMEREKRFRGFRYAMQEAGLPVDSRYIVNTGWNVDVSYSWMLSLLGSEEEERPTAVFAASDMMAISAMRAAAERGLRIPQDIAFIGLDNIEVSQYTSPTLSTIHIPKSETGMMAAKVLVDQMNGENPLPFKLYMPYRLLVRQSSDFVRS